MFDDDNGGAHDPVSCPAAPTNDVAQAAPEPEGSSTPTGRT